METDFFFHPQIFLKGTFIEFVLLKFHMYKRTFWFIVTPHTPTLISFLLQLSLPLATVTSYCSETN